MVQMTQQFADFLGGTKFREMSMDADKELAKPMFEQLFKVKKSDSYSEKTSGMTGFGMAGLKTQGQSVTYDQPHQLFDQEITNIVYSIGTKVTYEMALNNKWDLIAKYPKWMAKTLDYTIDVKCAVVFNSGTAVTYYTTAASEALFKDTHVNLTAASSGGDNIHTAAALSQTGLQAAIDDWGGWTNHRGQKLNIDPKYLLIPRQLKWKAGELLKSAQQPETANNAYNVILDENLVAVQWNQLTSTTRWFLLAKPADHTLTFYKRDGFGTPKMDHDYDHNTWDLSVNRGKYFGIGFPDWIGVSTNAGA